MKPLDFSKLERYVDIGYFDNAMSRENISRSLADKVKAWKLGHDYYDGDRRCGYGGFRNDGRWNIFLPRLLERCLQLPIEKDDFSILDIGCKKGFIVEAASRLGYNAIGVESHQYPLQQANPSIKNRLVISDYYNLPFVDKSFDFTIAFSSIYMNNLGGVIRSLEEIERVSRDSYVTVAAYNHPWEEECFSRWTLLGSTLLHCSEWLDLFNEIGFTGHYFFTTPTMLGFERPQL